MNRFYVNKKYFEKETIRIIDSETVRHLGLVLRLKEGEPLYISDGEGSAYLTRAKTISRKVIILEIKQKLTCLKREERKLCPALAVAVPQRLGVFENILDKCVQLDVDEIIPLWTQRTLMDRFAFERKQERLKRVLISAAKKSGSLFLTILRPPCLFADMLKEVRNYELCLAPNLCAKDLKLKDAVEGFAGRKILTFIGPEGDFTGPEIEVLTQAEAKSITLGESVLTVDTAAIAVASFLKLYFLC